MSENDQTANECTAPPAALEYRAPADDAKILPPRSVFRMVRWAVYGAFFLFGGCMCAYFLLAGMVRGEIIGYVIVSVIMLVLFALAGLAVLMIRQIWKGIP